MTNFALFAGFCRSPPQLAADLDVQPPPQSSARTRLRLNFAPPTSPGELAAGSATTSAAAPTQVICLVG